MEEEKLNKVKELLKKHNQEHLLTAYDKLSSDDQKRLLLQILNIDFDLMADLYSKTQKDVDIDTASVEPISYTDKSKLAESDYNSYATKGVSAIKSGKLAAVTMAGGQGTRLGHNGPKGTFDIGLPNHKSIFELLCDNLKEAREAYGVVVPWYIMTSNENNEATVNFFKENNFFGYPEDAIKFFKQGELPMIGTDGKILLDEKGMVKLAANGHGGIFESMQNTGVLADMESKGIEWAFIGGVDNVLVKMVDPVLMGMCIENNTMAGGKSLVKAYPEEKVGVFCKKNGRPSVIEYTEISKEMANATDENGELAYGESHILCNLFNVKAIEEICKNKLPYHSAFKKANYMDENGEIVKATEPNAYKFEAFIFDAFSTLDDMSILRVKREDEFAPVKNATGVDSPETARKLYTDFKKKQLEPRSDDDQR